jgi:thiamine pyrophosphate-dependent acetolactate synthase large subunit-like protein
MVNDGRTDYAAIARAAGFSRARTIATLDDFKQQLPGIAAEDGPSFTVLRVVPETGFLRTPPMTYEGPEMKYRFGRALERRLGIEVFGPQGY